MGRNPLCACRQAAPLRLCRNPIHVPIDGIHSTCWNPLWVEATLVPMGRSHSSMYRWEPSLGRTHSSTYRLEPSLGRTHARLEPSLGRAHSNTYRLEPSLGRTHSNSYTVVGTLSG